MEQQEEKIEIVVNTRKTKEIRFYVYADECTVDWGDGSRECYATPKPGIEDSDYWRTPKRPYCEHSYRGVNRVVTVTVSAKQLSEFIIEHIPDKCQASGLRSFRSFFLYRLRSEAIVPWR